MIKFLLKMEKKVILKKKPAVRIEFDYEIKINLLLRMVKMLDRKY